MVQEVRSVASVLAREVFSKIVPERLQNNLCCSRLDKCLL